MVTLDVSFSFYVPSLKYKKHVQIVIVAMKRNSGKDMEVIAVMDQEFKDRKERK